MTEAVRLVIWDLDETFWRGTLSEGGVQRYVQDNHDLVIELAQRGIMSSVCSKNDFAPVETVLRQSGLWDYLVFPSIDWTPKAPRIAWIIGQSGLRAPTVLFIDDTPHTRAEARDHIPGLQVADETTIGGMRDDPRFHGKDDRKLTRLGQYKVQEQRQANYVASGLDRIAFLRDSNIRVEIDHEVERHVDRAVELIRRSNRLNFTKKRLPEDAVEAARILLGELKQFYMWSGLVRVHDRHGDYGTVGFFMGGGLRDGRGLAHFCFSCRIVGLGVEQWVYEHLDRPKLTIVGEVVSDPFDSAAVAWINTGAMSGDAPPLAGAGAAHLRLRGGCDLDAVAHYARGDGQGILRETNFAWNGLFVRADSSRNLALALQQDSPAHRVIAELGLGDAFATALFEPPQEATVVVLSLWADPYHCGLRHRSEGFVIDICPLGLDISTPLALLGGDPEAGLTPVFDAAKVDPENRPFLDHLLRRLARDFEPAGPIGEAEFRRNLHLLFSRASARLKLVFLLAPERSFEATGPLVYPRSVDMRAWSRDVASHYADVDLLDVEDCILDASEIMPQGHYSRLVYFRMHQRLCALLAPAARSRAA